MQASRTLQLGPVTLGPIPRLVAILEQPVDTPDLLELYRRGATVLEFRLDSFNNTGEGLDMLAEVAQNPELRQKFGLLATMRESDANRHLREAIFKQALQNADIIDVEFESVEREKLAELAREQNKLVLLSSHDFGTMPHRASLDEIVATANRLQASLYKIAALAKTQSETMHLLYYIEETESNALPVAIAMGEYGLVSRVIAPLFGSLLSYGFLTSANAPGQLSLDELHQAYLQYYPAYAADYQKRIT